jgi:hypothetical protein
MKEEGTMLFLNEKLIAAFLSILAFFVSFATSLYYKASVVAALLRGLIFAFIFLFVGLLIGTVIKNLIVEAFVLHQAKADAEAKAKEEAILQEGEETGAHDKPAEGYPKANP